MTLHDLSDGYKILNICKLIIINNDFTAQREMLFDVDLIAITPGKAKHIF